MKLVTRSHIAQLERILARQEDIVRRLRRIETKLCKLMEYEGMPQDKISSTSGNENESDAGRE